MEIQAVILAGGEGERLYPFNQSPTLPMCLLPLANEPLLSYSLNWCAKNGLKDIIVVVQKKQHKAVSKYLSELTTVLNIMLHQCDDETDSAQALNSVQHLITTTCLVLSVDLITNIPLEKILNHHRKHDPEATVVLTKAIKENKKENTDPMAITDYIGFEGETKSTINFFSTSSELKKDLKLHVNWMKRAPIMTISTSYSNAYMFLFSRKVLDILVEEGCSSITLELLPSLLKYKKKDEKSPLITSYLSESFTKRAYTLISYQNISKEISKGDLEDFPVNKQNYGTKGNIGNDCLVGEDASFSERGGIVLKRVVAGNSVHFGANVRITNSMIMNKVTIGDGCTISNSLIGNNVKIKAGVTLSGCTIAHGEEVGGEDEKEFKNEVLCKNE